jgi:hypothetical protein
MPCLETVVVDAFLVRRSRVAAVFCTLAICWLRKAVFRMGVDADSIIMARGRMLNRYRLRQRC